MSPITPSLMMSLTPGPLRRFLRRGLATTTAPSPSRMPLNSAEDTSLILIAVRAGAASFRNDRALPAFVATRVASDVSWGVRSE
jgi:hypothetical protein